MCRSQVGLTGSSPKCRGRHTLWQLLSASSLLPPMSHAGLPGNPPVVRTPVHSQDHHDPADPDWNTQHRPANCTSNQDPNKLKWKIQHRPTNYKQDCGCLGLDQATYMTRLHTCLFPMRKPVLSQSAEDSVHSHKQPVSLLLQGSILERAVQMHILQQESSISENSAEA